MNAVAGSFQAHRPAQAERLDPLRGQLNAVARLQHGDFSSGHSVSSVLNSDLFHKPAFGRQRLVVRLKKPSRCKAATILS